jgi:hypothetical protein
MIFAKWRYKCPACGSPEDVELVPQYGIYGGILRHWAYHRECLQEVLCKPEQHGHKLVDYMLGIAERLEKHQDKVDKRNEKIKSRCEQVTKMFRKGY